MRMKNMPKAELCHSTINMEDISPRGSQLELYSPKEGTPHKVIPPPKEATTLLALNSLLPSKVAILPIPPHIQVPTQEVVLQLWAAIKEATCHIQAVLRELNKVDFLNILETAEEVILKLSNILQPTMEGLYLVKAIQALRELNKADLLNILETAKEENRKLSNIRQLTMEGFYLVKAIQEVLRNIWEATKEVLRNLQAVTIAGIRTILDLTMGATLKLRGAIQEVPRNQPEATKEAALNHQEVTKEVTLKQLQATKEVTPKLVKDIRETTNPMAVIKEVKFISHRIKARG